MANMDYSVEYDRSDPISIEKYSQKMVGKTFREICQIVYPAGADVKIIRHDYYTIVSKMRDEAVDSFEDYVVEKINRYRGYTVNDLCTEFDVEREKKPKNLEAILAYRILGIKGNHAEEFEKANVVVKTIRIGKNNKIKESMSFPTFRFKELIQEDWKDSTFGNYLRETRFLFDPRYI